MRLRLLEHRAFHCVTVVLFYDGRPMSNCDGLPTNCVGCLADQSQVCDVRVCVSGAALNSWVWTSSIPLGMVRAERFEDRLFV